MGRVKLARRIDVLENRPISEREEKIIRNFAACKCEGGGSLGDFRWNIASEKETVARATFSACNTDWDTNERDFWAGSTLLVKKKESVVGRSLRHASFQFVAWNGSKFRIWFSIFRGANERFKEWIVTKLTKRCSLLHYIFEKSDLTCRNIYKNGNIDKFQNTMVVFLHYLIRYILFI